MPDGLGHPLLVYGQNECGEGCLAVQHGQPADTLTGLTDGGGTGDTLMLDLGHRGTGD